MLVTLMSFDINDPRSLEQWALHHAAEHDQVRQAIRTQKLTVIPAHELYPINWKDWEAWAMRHQLATNEENGVLGIAGTDLQGVNFRNEKDAAEWHFNHFRDHFARRTALKI